MRYLVQFCCSIFVMRFIFSRRFYIFLAIGLVPLSLSWNFPLVRWLVLAYDILLIFAAIIDWRISRFPGEISINRTFGKRFAIGDANDVELKVENRTTSDLSIVLKDEFPFEMNLSGEREGNFKVEAQSSASLIYKLTPPKRGKFTFGKIAVRYLSRLGLVWCQTEIPAEESVKVYPNMRRAREMELKALGAKSLVATKKRNLLRGEGREFESMRDYVRGDELRHISWTATARRGKLVTRQYQIERDQTILIAIDAGRLMTGRIDNESKFDTAIHSTLALMSASARGGDNAGIVVFGRKINKFLPPKRGVDHMDATLEALHDLEPEMIEPSYSRAFQFMSSNLKKRALVVILTDLVDEEGSRELLSSIKLLRPRHLPLIVTIGDRDLTLAVSKIPDTIRDVFIQSASEEIIHQRQAALKMMESQGCLTLDVTAASLAPKLLETYLKVKERGLI